MFVGVSSKTPGDKMVGDLGDDSCSEKMEVNSTRVSIQSFC